MGERHARLVNYEEITAIMDLCGGPEAVLKARKRAMVNRTHVSIDQVGELCGGRLEVRLTFDGTGEPDSPETMLAELLRMCPEASDTCLTSEWQAFLRRARKVNLE